MIRELAEEGLVVARPNPAHRRSHYLELTPAGSARLAALRRREQAALEALDLPFKPGEIGELAGALRRVRDVFEALGAGQGAPAAVPAREKP
jgi:DNA-binding MarR family transcriptional regulator